MYKKGKHNTNADALSRVQINALDTESMINNVDEDLNQLLDDIQEILSREGFEAKEDSNARVMQQNEEDPPLGLNIPSDIHTTK